MGLRFRKSVKICKGVKINFGKTGASLSLGTKGFHKTFHTSGKVTTSFGLPGTGIYWTETSNPRRSSSSSSRSTRSTQRQDISRRERIVAEPVYDEPYEAYTPVNERSATPVAEELDAHEPREGEKISNEPTPSAYYSSAEIKNIYRIADYPIDWIEIANSDSADEVEMDRDLWNYCKSVADDILDGDIDTYLSVIETLRPVDDLLLYAGDFEFGTEKSNSMTVEFTINLETMSCGELQNEYINAVSIRVARDIMALLPVSRVEVFVVDDNQGELSNVTFSKKALRSVNYNVLSATEIVDQIRRESR